MKIVFCFLLTSLAALPLRAASPGSAPTRPDIGVIRAKFGAPPAATAPTVYGSRPGTPFLLYLAAAGVGTNRNWKAAGLPAGLKLTATNGLITGITPAAGSYDISWSVTGSSATVGGKLTLLSGSNLCLTPPIGWNSWNSLEGRINETNIQQMADAIVRAGLMDYGFAYVNLDDQWAQSARVAGNLVPSTNRFPSGLAVLANYLHQRGLKFGIYSDAAATTCAGTQPGSYGHEVNDVNTFAAWGVDYLKYDYCGAPDDQATALSRYTTMGDALAASGRTVLFSICEWGQRSPWLWGTRAVGQLWRTTHDMRDHWEFATNHVRSQTAIGVLDALDLAAGLEGFQRPGAWNDPDMLTLGADRAGSSSAYGATGLNPAQERSMFSLWALLGAPMIFNADLRKLDPQSPFYNAAWAANMMDILGNTEIWAVNQDRLGRQAARVFRKGDVDIWRKDMSDGSIILGLINRGSDPQIAAISPTNALTAARDLWKHVELGTLPPPRTFSLAPYETRMLRLRPALPCATSDSPATVRFDFNTGDALHTSINRGKAVPGEKSP